MVTKKLSQEPKHVGFRIYRVTDTLRKAIKVSVRGRKSSKFFQAYRLPGDAKLYRAPCHTDLAKSRNRCWVEAHIRKATGVVGTG
jgi:hypothetical protein